MAMDNPVAGRLEQANTGRLARDIVDGHNVKVRALFQVPLGNKQCAVAIRISCFSLVSAATGC
jgi:hypothetical protein